MNEDRRVVGCGFILFFAEKFLNELSLFLIYKLSFLSLPYSARLENRQTWAEYRNADLWDMITTTCPPQINEGLLDNVNIKPTNQYNVRDLLRKRANLPRPDFSPS